MIRVASVLSVVYWAFAALTAAACCTLGGNLLAQDAAPLRTRIDAAVAARRVDAANSEVCPDGEFLRRVSMDLVGTIPTSIECRAFLDDPAPNKREVLVDRLLADPRFTRQMTIAFDVWLMERRPIKHVPQADWSAFLYSSFAENRPLNEIVRDVLAADGTDEKKRAAARFYLDRDGEKNLVTRDVARIFLGRDVQCSQCHDHPIVDDYLQEDYYGLFSFYNRSFVFTDAAAKKSFYAENAEGELVDYKSVFVGIPHKARPHLPGELGLDEPRFLKGQEYVVAPAKDVRPVPKYSRREKLAADLTSPQNRTLARTLANRLWGHLLGRGIVHPYDMDHSDNPPSHPELLELLTDDFIATKFDARRFLKEVALSQTYQRTPTMPAQPMSDKAAFDQKMTETTTRLAQLEVELKAAIEEANKLDKELQPATVAFEAAAAELSKAEVGLGDAQQKVSVATAALKTAEAAVVTKTAAAQPFVELAALTKQANEKVPGDPELVKVAALFAARATKLNAELDAATKLVPQRTAELAAAMPLVGPATLALTTATAPRDLAAAARLPILDRKRAAEQRVVVIRRERDSLKQLQIDGQVLGDYVAALVQTPPMEPAAIESLFSKWAERWTKRFFVVEFEPMTPEQFALSALQASGQLQTHRTIAEAAEKAKADKEGKPVDPTEFARRVEVATYARVAPELAGFVAVLSPGSGPGVSEYQATVQEALFLKNGSRVINWIKPQSGNLADRLSKLPTPPEVADELYLATMTRRPSASEVEQVAKHLTAREADRPVAIDEMIWGLVSSAEFRFSH